MLLQPLAIGLTLPHRLQHLWGDLNRVSIFGDLRHRWAAPGAPTPRGVILISVCHQLPPCLHGRAIRTGTRDRPSSASLPLLGALPRRPAPRTPVATVEQRARVSPTAS